MPVNHRSNMMSESNQNVLPHYRWCQVQINGEGWNGKCNCHKSCARKTMQSGATLNWEQQPEDYFLLLAQPAFCIVWLPFGIFQTEHGEPDLLQATMNKYLAQPCVSGKHFSLAHPHRQEQTGMIPRKFFVLCCLI